MTPILPPGWELRASLGHPAGEPPRGAFWAVDLEHTGAATVLCASPELAMARAWAVLDRLQAMLADVRRYERKAA